MAKPFLLEYGDTKQDIIDAINKHIDNVPAIFMADILDSLAIQFRMAGNAQYEAARVQFEQNAQPGVSEAEKETISDREKEAIARHYDETIGKTE